MDDIHFGERLRDIATQQGTNVSELAENLEVTRQQVYNIFKSKDVSTEILKKFAEYYQIPLQNLITDMKITKSIIIAGNESFKMKKIENSINSRDELEKEIQLLKTIINDKEEIIQLLKKSMG